MTLATDRQTHVLVPFDEVELHPKNARRADIPSIVASIRDLGWFGACGRQASSGYLIWGNGRYQAAQIARDLMARAAAGDDIPDADAWRAWPEKFGALDQLPIFDLDVDDDEALLILVRDNNTSDRADYDRPALGALLAEIEESRGGLGETGYSETERDDLIREDVGPIDRGPTVSLADRFLVPPFSILDARQGYWQERKRAWLALGIQSELGRPQNTLQTDRDHGIGSRGGTHVIIPDFYARKRAHEASHGPISTPDFEQIVRRSASGLTLSSLSGRVPDYYAQKNAADAVAGRTLSNAEFERDHLVVADYAGLSTQGTSIFDPVLAELAVRWYCPPDGRVLDPFAGGSVRGIVASRLGREYVGIDLSEMQIAANYEQRAIGGDPEPDWITGDARDVRDLDVGGPFDLLLTCPPYFDLERYSDDPADLSNAADWPTFCVAYEDALVASLACLRPGAFAVIVVGNLRDDDGRLLDLAAATTAACAAGGAYLYNDAVLVTPVGSLPVRAGRSFAAGRKLGRTHQYVLVYVKPPLADALARLGDVEIGDLAEMFGEEL